MNLTKLLKTASVFIFSVLSMNQVEGRLNGPTNFVNVGDDYYKPPTKNNSSIINIQ